MRTTHSAKCEEFVCKLAGIADIKYRKMYEIGKTHASERSEALSDWPDLMKEMKKFSPQEREKVELQMWAHRAADYMCQDYSFGG